MYYIYHIPGVKIGCTDNIAQRMKAQEFSDWEILEKYRNIYTASKREIELQKEYGYTIDQTPYWHTAKMWKYSKGKPKPNHPGPSKKTQSKGGKGHRHLTFDQAEEIRSKYVPRKYTANMLAEEYKVLPTTIRKIIYGQYYLD